MMPCVMASAVGLRGISRSRVFPLKVPSPIAPNGKPLVYVDDTYDKGCDIFFPSNGQAMELPQASGEMTRIQRTGGGFEFDAEALPPTQCPPAGRGVDL